MKTDYAYCLDKGTCIHRRDCRRWVGNYTDKERKDMANTNRGQYINDGDCVPDYSDVNCTNDFSELDRFRNSDGGRS